MSSSRTTPTEADILCENCGYMLNGLPPSGNCPECGATIDSSVSAAFRSAPAWERTDDPRPAWRRFAATSAAVIFRTRQFYRGLNSRGPIETARRFAHIHWMIASVFLGLAGWLHLRNSRNQIPAYEPLILIPVIYGTIFLVNRMAIGLTSFEANYRGFRLPSNVVTRALAYLTALLSVVSAAALLTVSLFAMRDNQRLSDYSAFRDYLLILCAQVVFSAGYLFWNYWTAMRNLMYANH